MLLTNLLPGLRQLRAPLAAGYLWVLFIYFVADLNQVKPGQSELVRDVIDLGNALTPVGRAVAISFAAYLLGSLSQWIGQLLWSAVPKGELAQGPLLSTRGHAALEDLLAVRVTSGVLTSLDEARRLARDVRGELDLVKTRLLGSEPEVYSEVDRLHAEADFRFALLLPLTAVSVIALVDGPLATLVDDASVTIFPALVVALLVLEVFAFQARSILQQANDKLIDAIYLDRVSSPTLERWDRDAAAAEG